MNAIPEGYRKNTQGHLVPEDKVATIDKIRDELVLNIVEKGKALQVAMAEFKAASMAQVSDFLDVSAEEYDVKYGGAKGNVALLSYDGEYKLTRTIGEHRVFDERIQAAKAKIDECIGRWSEGANDNIKVMVNHAFRVNKQGYIDVNQVLSLRQYDINDKDWLEAMDAISDSIRTTGSKPYLRLYQRNKDDGYDAISLDFAKL